MKENYLEINTNNYTYKTREINHTIQFKLLYNLSGIVKKYLNTTSITVSTAQPPLPTSVQPISIAKTLLIVPTKNKRDPPLFTGKLLIKFQNILRNTTQVIIRHRVKILFSVISSPITLERQK
jgi:hypothetical protein